MSEKVLVKLVKTKHKNIIFYFFSGEKKIRLRIRNAENVKYLTKLVKYVEENGVKYSRVMRSARDNRQYESVFHELLMEKEEIRKLLITPRRKATVYDKLVSLLKRQ